MWTAAILAGGRARRLGGVDKSALLIGSESILARQLSALAGLTPHILIVADERSRFSNAGVPVVEDRIADRGALGGLYTAMMEASTQQVVAIACDMPFLTASFLAHLAAAGADVDAAVPRTARGRHPLCASYMTHIAPRLRSRIDAGQLRVEAALAEMRVREIGPDEIRRFDPDGRLLTNVNTPDEYEQAQRAAGSHL